MKKINFKQPKYIIPIIILPFIAIIFFATRKYFNKKNPKEEKKTELQTSISDVSDDIKQREIENKLDAFSKKYKEGDGYTALENIETEREKNEIIGVYNEKEKRMLDSIENVNFEKNFKNHNIPQSTNRYQPKPDFDEEDRDPIKTLEKSQKNSSNFNKNKFQQEPKEKDPMSLFKEQMKYMDSIGKSYNPDYQNRKKQEKILKELDSINKNKPRLSVVKVDENAENFNTIKNDQTDNFIKAIIDENVKGFQGSRIRIRLLDDIKIGKNTIIKKGAYLYALISGFEAQRVKLTISSIINNAKILPVDLSLFDMDGIEGLYVPESAFRQFTKDITDLGNNMTSQQEASDETSLYISALQKMFQSTTTAISNSIKKNKAKIKYDTFIYLIDKQELQNAKNY